jgi:predicted nucleic acid-binding protein
MESPMILSNTTPLINFAEIGRMEVLEVLFGTLVIPPAVVSELAAKALLFPQAARVPSLPFVKSTAPEDQLLVKSLTTRVHPGEAECLALPMENPGSLLLPDDLGAREIAASHDLLYTGTLGCLVEAFPTCACRGFPSPTRPCRHR